MGAKGSDREPESGYEVGSLVVFFLEFRVLGWDLWKEDRLGNPIHWIPLGKLVGASRYICHTSLCSPYL